MTLSFKKLFYAQASLILFLLILYFGKDILVPLAFAMLFAFILYPLVTYLIRKGLNEILSIAFTLAGVMIIGSGILILFSTEIYRMTEEYSRFLEKLKSIFNTSVTYLNEQVSVIPRIESENLITGMGEFFTSSGMVIVSDTISFTSTFFSYILLSIIYTFLILLYRKQLADAITQFVRKEHQTTFRKMLREVQKVGQQYFTGMLLLILILGVLNSTGLLILGIDYPFFFGFLAALLAIIPYVGSTVGGLIPTIYALISYDSYWYPIGVVGIFWFIQTVEGNFLNPKIVGGSLHINALFSILSLIAGGLLWGIPGMILFLPMTAILRVVCSHYEGLKPVASLIGDDKESSGGKLKLSAKLKSLVGAQ